MKYTTMIFWGLLTTAVVMTCAGCIFVAGTHKHDEDCIEEPVLDGAWADPQTGSFDFFLEDDHVLATKCLTCGIHFTHPSYGEHIKTCCP